MLFTTRFTTFFTKITRLIVAQRLQSKWIEGHKDLWTFFVWFVSLIVILYTAIKKALRRVLLKIIFCLLAYFFAAPAPAPSFPAFYAENGLVF